MTQAIIVILIFIVVALVLHAIWASPGCCCDCQQGHRCKCEDAPE